MYPQQVQTPTIGTVSNGQPQNTVQNPSSGIASIISGPQAQLSNFWDELGSPVKNVRNNKLIPGISGYNADITSVENVYKGKATSEDYGQIVGTAVGAYFGAPQAGGQVGRAVFKGIRDLF